MADSDVDALLIHAVYLLNAASEDPEIREKTLTSLIASLQAGDALGAVSVVLHPGSAQDGRGRAGDRARRRGHQGGAGRERALRAAPGEHRGRRRHAGPLVRGAGGADRRGAAATSASGICLDSCHLFASRLRHPHRGGPDRGARRVRPRSSASTASARCTSTTRRAALGTNRDRHADIGKGELGEDGCAVFLSEPRFETLPVILETPGPDKKGTPPRRSRWRASCASAGCKARGALKRRQRVEGDLGTTRLTSRASAGMTGYGAQHGAGTAGESAASAPGPATERGPHSRPYRARARPRGKSLTRSAGIATP